MRALIKPGAAGADRQDPERAGLVEQRQERLDAEMAADRQGFVDLDRQLVDAVEPGRQEQRQAAVLVTPELLVIDQLAGRLQQFVDGAAAPPGRQPLGRGRQQLAQPDRVLAHLAAGRVGRQVERDARVLVAGEQFVQVGSEKHGRPRCGRFCLSQPATARFVPERADRASAFYRSNRPISDAPSLSPCPAGRCCHARERAPPEAPAARLAAAGPQQLAGVPAAPSAAAARGIRAPVPAAPSAAAVRGTRAPVPAAPSAAAARGIPARVPAE